MKLKRVSIYGFKTFADRTEVEVDADLTAIVGPNGCGKSNIVDAILWGLGESKSSNLRAKTSADVIFAGSGRRKALGFAEVTLTFDNEDGALPMDAPEVSLTRRVTRRGDSHYRINGRTCRLRDVVDLLSDSGLGRAGYAIVGQQEIDQALAASPERRRNWIDEAAGVMRYRVRRTESLRRLDSAQDHLDRVHDIVSEIETQREPLRAEAEIARRYKQAMTSLRSMESGMLIHEVAKIIGQLKEVDEQLAGAIKMVEQETTRAEELEREAATTAAKIEQLDTDLDALRERYQEERTALERAIAERQVAQSRLESLSLLETSLGADSEQADRQIQDAALELEKATETEKREIDALSALRVDLSGADQEARGLAKQLAEIEKELVVVREATAKSQRAELERAHKLERLRAIDVELAGIRDGIPDIEKAIQDGEKVFEEVDGAVASSKSAIEAAVAALRQLREQEEECAAKVRRLMNEIAVLDGRRGGLQSTIDSHEGLAQGALAIMSAVESGDLHGKYLPLGECLEVDSEYAVAIEVALGAAANDLIVRDQKHAQVAVDLLKSRKLGRATFRPLSLLWTRPQVRKTALRQRAGVIGFASELVKCDDAHRPIVDSVLSGVVVTDTLATSLELAKESGFTCFVSLGGDVVDASGSITGGEAANGGTGVVRRIAELRKVESKIVELTKALELLEADRENCEQARAEHGAKLDESRKTADDLVVQHDESKSWLLNLRHELQATVRGQEKLEAERDSIQAEPLPDESEIDATKVERQRDGILKSLVAKSADAEGAEVRLHEADARAAEAKQRRTDIEVRVRNLTEAQAVQRRRTANLEPDRERQRKLILETESRIEAAEKSVEGTEGELSGLATKKREVVEAGAIAAREAKAAQVGAQTFADQAHRAEVKRVRLDTRRTATAQRLVEEYGVTEIDAVNRAPKTEIPADARQLVPRLRRELKEMGDVNLGAIEAFERLTERHEELTAQSQDILSGMAEIKESIHELDLLTQDRFQATFAKLQVAFAETFRKLFDGGEVEIALLDPKHPLDSGVDIRVTVPGKRRQRLELLSGGERALAATAFIFALLKVKPSPLVILDEVDAPLDGRNVERYISLLREFTDNSQFILITHNPVTIAAADVWFGVTMQEPGVSVVVPCVLPEARQDELAPAKAYVKG